MNFTAKDVQALREMTGVGMMKCKEALTAADGDMNKAVEILREKGLAAATKKAGRIAAEGAVSAIVKDGVGAIVEVNCETDFAAKNEKFTGFAENVAAVVADKAPADLDALLALPYPNSEVTVDGMLKENILVIGENLKIRRFDRYGEGVSVPYVHMGGKIGVLVNMEVSDNIKDSEQVVTLGKDLAMQIAAMRPTYLCSKCVPAEEVAKEEEIIRTQALQEGKPEKAIESIIKGRINKFYEEICLLSQPFVKENKISVSQHVANVAKELGGQITVKAFTRYEKGEGIEKKEDNFAAEVAGMVK
ncbi:MAG: elongation factor Ts [Oscillospiraceae bacterium]|nr:elongation factor Ts [Oscillospiraceae bacterium]